jgi:hypothetical protein
MAREMTTRLARPASSRRLRLFSGLAALLALALAVSAALAQGGEVLVLTVDGPLTQPWMRISSAVSRRRAPGAAR